MAEFTDLLNYRTFLDKLWETKRTESIFNGWHAHGFRIHEGALITTAFFEIGTDQQTVDAFRQRLTEFSAQNLMPPKTEIVFMEQFQQMHSGTASLPIPPLQPGGRLFTTNPGPRCADGCNGTVGAFVTPVVAENGPVWLLSNHHILAEKQACLLGTEVRGSAGTVVSRIVKPVDLAPDGNAVDAAIAKVTQSDQVHAVYPGVDIECTAPEWPAAKLLVQKLGNATSVTSGIFVGCCSKVSVRGCNLAENFEFTDQLIFASQPGAPPFLDHGDSGSLVVGNKHPVGLLFAISESDNAGISEDLPGTAPFGLANPFQAVLDSLPKDDSLPEATAQVWRMILDSSQNKCNQAHNQQPPANCIGSFTGFGQ